MRKVDVIEKETMILISKEEANKLKYGIYRAMATFKWDNDFIENKHIRERNNAAIKELQELLEMLS